MNYESLIMELKKGKDRLSHAPSSWSDYLFSKTRTKNSGVKGDFSYIKCSKIEQYLFERLQPVSENDSYKDRLSDAQKFTNELFSRLYEDSKSIDEPVQWASMAHSEIDKIPAMSGLIEAIDGDSDIAYMCTKEIIEEAAEAISKLRISTNQSQEELNELAAMIRKAVSNQIDKSQKIKSAKKSAGDILASNDSGNQDMDSRSDLINKMISNDDFSKSLTFIGRLIDTMASLPSKTNESKDFEFSGLTYGDDISRMTSSDLIDLANPETEDLFDYKYLNSQLSIEERKGIACKSRGSMILLIDKSGSMQGDDIFWAKCLSGAMLRLCLKDKRPCTIIPFNGKAYAPIKMQNHRNCSIGKQKYNVPELFQELMDITAGGGTSFEAPFKSCLNHIKEDSDIILLTDGHAYDLEEETRNALDKHKENGLRVWTILLNEPEPTEEVAQLSDKVVQINTRLESEEEIIKGIAKSMKLSMQN